MDAESALAIIFANTRRRKRKEDLLTVAEAFQFLLSIYGSQERVALETDLSREMVREFLQILTLQDYVKSLIRSRKIDTIDTAYRLSTIKDEKSLKTIVSKLSDLQTHDLRDAISTSVEAQLSIDEASKMVLKAKPKNLRVFIIDFDDKNYNKLLVISKSRNCSPADVVKEVMNNWLNTATGGT